MDPAINRKAVAGLFTNEDQAERALKDLKAAGFKDNEIGVAMGGPSGDETGADRAAQKSHPGVWGKVKSLFGAESHFSNDEDLIQTFESSGVAPEQARYFDGQLQHGGVVVTVNCGPDRLAMAEQILTRDGADLGTSRRAVPHAPATPAGRQGLSSQRIELLGEVLRVHKERVARGEVRLRKEVVTDKQTVQVPVTREELVIERHPATGTEPGRAAIGSDKEIRIPLSEEQVRVEKRPVVREEVTVAKKPVQETKNVSDDVRHEELKVEREGEAKVRGDQVPQKPGRVA